MNYILAIIGFLALAGFLLILIFEVPRVDLGIVVGLTLVLALVDFVREMAVRKNQ